MPIVSVVPEYVLGFYFLGSWRAAVVLINKLKPESQAGKLNGIGGRVEQNETPLDAMVREFREETGKPVDGGAWTQFARLEFRDATVYCFQATGDTLGIGFGRGNSPTPEIVTSCFVNNLPSHVMPNLRWLIPMAMSGETNMVIRCD